MLALAAGGFETTEQSPEIRERVKCDYRQKVVFLTSVDRLSVRRAFNYSSVEKRWGVGGNSNNDIHTVIGLDAPTVTARMAAAVNEVNSIPEVGA